MNIAGDMRVLYHIVRGSSGGNSHAERLEGFYRNQARDYDDFRRRLLKGREAMLSLVTAPEGGVWVDMGGGTGANVEALGEERLRGLKRVYIVDLCPSLLGQARERIARNGWRNVETVEADATSFVPPEGRADLVTFSYSLTMIPDWFAAIDHACRLVEQGGQVGVVDFYVARKHPEDGRLRHPWRTRAFWPVWFAADNVFPSPDHLPYLQKRLLSIHVLERRARVPYMPVARVPFYIFVGRAN